MNAIPGRATLGRAQSLILGATQRAADRIVIADRDAAQDIRDAAARFHAALSQAEFVTAPPVTLAPLIAGAALLARVDLDAYQRAIVPAAEFVAVYGASGLARVRNDQLLEDRT